MPRASELAKDTIKGVCDFASKQYTKLRDKVTKSKPAATWYEKQLRDTWGLSTTSVALSDWASSLPLHKRALVGLDTKGGQAAAGKVLGDYVWANRDRISLPYLVKHNDGTVADSWEPGYKALSEQIDALHHNQTQLVSAQKCPQPVYDFFSANLARLQSLAPAAPHKYKYQYSVSSPMTIRCAKNLLTAKTFKVWDVVPWPQHDSATVLGTSSRGGSLEREQVTTASDRTSAAPLSLRVGADQCAMDMIRTQSARPLATPEFPRTSSNSSPKPHRLFSASTQALYAPSVVDHKKAGWAPSWVQKLGFGNVSKHQDSLLPCSTLALYSPSARESASSLPSEGHTDPPSPKSTSSNARQASTEIDSSLPAASLPAPVINRKKRCRQQSNDSLAQPSTGESRPSGHEPAPKRVRAPPRSSPAAQQTDPAVQE